MKKVANDTVITVEKIDKWFEELGMSKADNEKLNRVAGFAAKINAGKPLKVDSIVHFFNSCVASAKPFTEETLHICAAYCKDAGVNRDNAFDYFDEDGNGVIDRGELFRGFRKMNVGVNKRQIANLYVLLDQNYDHEISTLEFESIFAKYLEPGPQSQGKGKLRFLPIKFISEGEIDQSGSKSYSVGIKLMDVNGHVIEQNVGNKSPKDGDKKFKAALKEGCITFPVGKGVTP